MHTIKSGSSFPTVLFKTICQVLSFIYIIDDEPDGANDPQHYIIITSVYEPHVLQPLIDLGVAVDGIIKVKSETYIQNEEHTDPVEKDEQACYILLVSFVCVAFL